MGKKVKTADKNDSKLVKAATPLPKLQVFCICSVQMAEAMNGKALPLLKNNRVYDLLFSLCDSGSSISLPGVYG